MVRYFIFLAILLLAQCQPVDEAATRHRFESPKLQQIYDWQDQRQAEDLLPLLSDNDSIVREATALAFSSVQNPLGLEALSKLISDPAVSVRLAAAYALGQQYDTILQSIIIKGISQEETPEVTNRLLEALGKCSTLSLGLKYLSDRPIEDTRTTSGTAWGIYRAGLRNIYSEASVAKALSLLASGDFQTRLGAAHFLARTRGLKLKDHYLSLKQALEDPEPEIRMAVAMALGKCHDLGLTPLLARVQEDSDYRVRINAIRALSGFDPSIGLNWDILLKATQDQQPAVGLTAAQFLKDFGPDSLAGDLQALASTTPDKRVAATLWAATLKHSKIKANITGDLQDQFSESSQPYEQAHLIAALSENINSYSFLKAVLFGNNPKVVTTEAINSIFAINKNEDFKLEWQPIFSDIYEQAIRSGDVAIMGIAAQALRQPQLNYKDSFEDLNFLQEALDQLSLPRDMETYLELERTKNYLTGDSTPLHVQPPYNNPISWAKVTQIPRGQRIVILTTRGEIEMELMVDESPGTVAFIWELMESGFYNGKTFHRVVPNFVAQGGCPRGDGWGSTEVSIRSELGPEKYTTGSVGVASAGKDTESCQWFITHSPTPHLDGRYTIFAKVTAGMDIVHLLQPGDQIQKIARKDVHGI